MKRPEFFTGLRPEQLSQAKTFRTDLDKAQGQTPSSPIFPPRQTL
jgi:hypothetical protein